MAGIMSSCPHGCKCISNCPMRDEKGVCHVADTVVTETTNPKVNDEVGVYRKPWRMDAFVY